MLFSAILAAALAQSPAQLVPSTVEPDPDEPDERDLSFTLELTGGRQLGAAGYVDYGVLPNRLYLNAGYTLLKSPALAATDTTPALPTSPTHVFSGGVDWTPGRHFSLGLLGTGSPRATDQVLLNPGAPPLTQLTVTTWRSSLGGSLMAAWASGGMSDFEWVVDAGLAVSWNRLGRGVRAGGPLGAATSAEDRLWTVRGLGGLSVTLFDRTDVALRGGVSAYSADPLTAGRFSEEETVQIARTLLAGAADRFTGDVSSSSRAAQQAATRLGQADSLSGYASAPVWVEAKVQVRHRFTRRVSAQLGWTFNRYVPTAGYGNTFSARVTVKLGERWRVWGGAAVQHDEPIDHPAQRAAGDPQPSLSGLATVGVELTL